MKGVILCCSFTVVEFHHLLFAQSRGALAYVNFRFPELARICPSLSGAPEFEGSVS